MTTETDMMLLESPAEPERRRVQLAGGTLVAYTCRAPDKESDNEDTVAAIPWGDDGVVMVVADGAGGLPAGRRASRTAVTELARSLRDAAGGDTLLRTAILNGIEAANRAVLDSSNGAATTLTVAALEGDTARTFQIGDSEALVVGQRGHLRLQTMAHSPTGFAVEAGLLDERAALHHEERHLVSNFIGMPEMRIDVGPVTGMRVRDTVLVASDGLTDNLHLHEIVEIVRKGPLDKAIDALVDRAARRMRAESGAAPSKPDDLSLILFRRHVRRGRGKPAG